MLTNEGENPSSDFECNKCDYVTSKKSSFEKHLLTPKHLKKMSLTEKVALNEFMCNKCKKLYKSRVGLWYHSKKCDVVNNDINLSEKELIMQILKQNQVLILENKDFKKMLIDLASKPINTNTTTTTTNNTNNNTNTNQNITNTNMNSHNKQFNLNFFLNETCKDAMNMSEFMDSIAIKAGELEDMGRLGYIRGISNIFIRALNDVDETKRPIHCTDIKREILYIKENNVWTKDTPDNLKIRKIIKYIADKNFRRIPKWQLDNPDSEDVLSKKNTDFMIMLGQVMTGITPDDDTGINKIIRNVANHVYLDKKSMHY